MSDPSLRSGDSPDRCFSPDPTQRALARTLYETVRDLPLVCPHGHVDPWLLADAEAAWGSPADVLVIPDHYVFRMLYSQGIPLEALGVPARGARPGEPALPAAPRQVWQLFAERFHLFRGTPTGYWLADELTRVFGVTDRLCGETAQAIYDQIADRLAEPAFRPRALFERFQIEALCTTDAATDTLEPHRRLWDAPWGRDAAGKPRLRPTFRPDGVIKLDLPAWRGNVETLGQLCGMAIYTYAAYVQALETRRSAFKALGAAATDHDALTPQIEALSPAQAETLFERALRGQATAEDAMRFQGHMLMEMARMSAEDGLVMQLHVGSFRNHNAPLFERFGPDRGADIPVQTEWTRNLRPLLHAFGNDSRLTLILFGLDESNYSRELAPLAGHYPALRLGPPWWFHDSYHGMRRYLEGVMETAGLYNTVGFNDDTRAFPSIPARHDLWRRVCADWLAGLAVRGLIDEEDAGEMILDCAYRLAKRAYRL